MEQGKLIVGNWKMNGLLAQCAEVTALTQHLGGKVTDSIQVVVCTPATLHLFVRDATRGTRVQFGGQDCSVHQKGAHTGDLSAAMFADLGATFCIVGHSERRANHHETDATVNQKASAALSAGLMPIICVGESEAQRDAGQAETIVLSQIAGSIPTDADPSRICVAYEPVWAIGTGRTPSVDDVATMHSAIRASLQSRFGEQAGFAIAILYGGSVNGNNAGSLLAVANVDGALVGGASLTADSFMEIIATQL
jgi:triosephosphate isomerase (TIM)